MDAMDFKLWQLCMRYNNVKAADKLGMSVGGIEKYRVKGVKNRTVMKLMDVLEAVK